MVVDGRHPSSLHRRPPHTPLGSPGCLATLDLSNQLLERQGFNPGLVEPCGAGVDLEDGFHQFSVQQLGSWFGFNFPERAGIFDIDSLFDEDLDCMVPVAADAMV